MSDTVNSVRLDRECVHVVFLGLPNVPGVAAEIFKALAQWGVGVDRVTQNTMRGGRSDLSFLVRKDRLDEIIPICREVSARVGAQGVSFATEIASITVAVRSVTEATQVLAKMFSALAEAEVNAEIINSGPESVICVVSLVRAEEGLRALRTAFQEP